MASYGNSRIQKIKESNPVYVDYLFILRNTIFILIIAALFFVFKDSILNLSNDYRYINIIYIAVAGILYYGLIAVFNYKDIISLKNETILVIKGKNWKLKK